MPVDLVERDDAFVVTVDLPGVETDDVDLRVTDRTLHIEVTQDASPDEEGEYLRHERRKWSTRRSITLPEAIETDDVNATMHNGVLTVTVPKREAEEPREVEIQ